MNNQQCFICFEKPCKCKFANFNNFLLIILIIILSSCSASKNSSDYQVIIVKEKQCQTLLNEEKGTNYNHCKEVHYFNCGYYIRSYVFVNLKIFTKSSDANEYCEKIRNQNFNKLDNKKIGNKTNG